MKPVKPIFVAVIALAVGVAAFFGGMHYQQLKRRADTQQFGGQFFQRGAGNGQFRMGGRQGMMQSGGAVVGEIIKQDDTSVTVRLPDGSSKIVILSGSTIINTQATGTKEDIKTGERVAVVGTANSDGSITAQSIQLNPMMRGR